MAKTAKGHGLTKREKRHLQRKVYTKAGFAVLALGLFFLMIEGKVVYPGGVMADSEPKQILLEKSYKYPLEELQIEVVGSFEMEGKILSKKRYRFTDESKYIPFDYAMGWESMSNQSVVDRLDIWQKDRWYFYKAKTNNDGHIQASAKDTSANMHMFPTSMEMFEDMKKAKQGEIIKFSGRLVNFTTPEGRTFRTSTSRTDSGAGACEIIVVDRFEVVEHKNKREGFTLPLLRETTFFITGGA